MLKEQFSPLLSPGGKTWAIDIYNPIIIDCAQKHNLSTYIEATGAGARMLANMEQGVFKKRIYNELDYDFCCYFASLSDIKETKRLMRVIEVLVQNFSPKELFELCKQNVKNKELDKRLVAAFAFIRSFGSFRANRMNFNADAFRRNIIDGRRYLKLLDYNSLLQGITVTNTDCFNLLKKYNNNSDFFYFGDFPYWRTKVYGKERDWKDERYRTFVDIAKNAKMKMMICDTENPYYDNLVKYNGWFKHFIKTKSNSMGKKHMLEHIWVNFNVSSELLSKYINKAA